ncbi:spore protease YyaC [Desulfosporosinus sp.]|uniref:spore protease YyaC n=1 Tax=Desulfosporosinus sp. TaxID=157907 RepID=UPI002314B59E|nr:spore protease YyaC [Desulfosporosinus sp.]MCO5385077.1 spore protease YyaC [Desulfosporosinus sp.]MDA8220599.1 spore protease YyaC [Desulfitobacterium hafniense]
MTGLIHGGEIITTNSRRILASVNSFNNNYWDKLSFVAALKELTYMKKVLFTCIGTDRATGDCLGPLVGTNLKRLGYSVLGTLDEPLHAQNLIQELKRVSTIHNPDIVVAIDACLGKLDEVGKITLSNSPLTPGAALKKELPAVGDISIMGIVNMGGFLELQVLQCTRLHTVMKLASDITHLIWQAVPASRKETQLLNK